MDAPNAHKTVSNTGPDVRLKKNEKRKTVSSRTTSQSPRVHRNRVSMPRLRPGRESQRNAPHPAVKKKTGAQKCVIHRVKNKGTFVLTRSSGEKDMAPSWKKSRT